MMIEMARTRARPLEAEDSELVFDLLNELGRVPSQSSCASEVPISIERVRKWIKEVNCLQSEMHMVLSKKRGGDFGLLSVTDMDLANQSARVAFLMRDGDLRRGYGTETLTGVLDFLFERYNLHRIWARTEEEHEAALTAFSKAGFEFEGTLREDHYSGGCWRGSHLMSILSEDFWGKSHD